MESDHVMMMRTTATFRTRSCDDCVRVRAITTSFNILSTNSFYKKSKAFNSHFLRLSLPSSLFDPYIEDDIIMQCCRFFEVSLKVQMGDSQYSFSLTTFSPSGKLVQIEHALTAVGSGQTSLGIKASNGVVIATEKKLPSILVDEASVQKIQNLTPNIGVVYSGMGPDFRVLVRKSRKQAEQYNRLYKEPIPVTQLVRETATVMQEFTQSGGVRPFGVSLLVAGYDDKGPQLYQVDPSGSYFSWKASAMGKNVSNAKTFLEKRYTEDMELDDAIHTAILTLKEGFEGEISSKNIEIGKIGADKVFRVLTPAEIDDYLAEVE
ncbi:unnamed protein product [Brassica napus]|uniref:(rape) hypothetical protein n=1 Tax=Brassica napus TaxID=3708 RepID=A0A816ZEP7_BRANA|nr:unnamed protein product [Brassica napus]